MAEIRLNNMSSSSNKRASENSEEQQLKKRRFSFEGSTEGKKEEESSNEEFCGPLFAGKFNNTETVVELKRGAIVINKKRKPLFKTPPLTVKECYLGPDGNLVTKYVKYNKNKARFKVVVCKQEGVSEQEAFFTWVRNTSCDILNKVWDTEMFKSRRARLLKQAQQELDDAADDESSEDVTEDEESSAADESSEEESSEDVPREKIEERAKSLFISGAKLPGVERMDLSSWYVNPQTNEVNRPKLWKKNSDGRYEDVTESVDKLTEGSVIVAQVRFRVFDQNGKYGVATDLGPDLEIVSQNQIPTKQPLKRRRFTRCT